MGLVAPDVGVLLDCATSEMEDEDHRANLTH